MTDNKEVNLDGYRVSQKTIDDVSEMMSLENKPRIIDIQRKHKIGFVLACKIVEYIDDGFFND